MQPRAPVRPAARRAKGVGGGTVCGALLGRGGQPALPSWLSAGRPATTRAPLPPMLAARARSAVHRVGVVGASCCHESGKRGTQGPSPAGWQEGAWARIARLHDANHEAHAHHHPRCRRCFWRQRDLSVRSHMHLRQVQKTLIITCSLVLCAARTASRTSKPVAQRSRCTLR